MIVCNIPGSVGQQVTAQLTVDERETTELVLELVAVADKNGLRLPREFGFLLKQVRWLYVLGCNADLFL